MQLKIDVQRNRITCGTRQADGRHRWEAALLSGLLAAGHAERPGLLGADALNRMLMDLGQEQPLQRRQWARLMDGLRDCFDRLGPEALQGFELRFGHGPRARTVGPWWWKPQPGDLWQLQNPMPAMSPDAEPSAGGGDLPDLAPGDVARALQLCQSLVVTQTLSAEGLPQEALDLLVDEAAWQGASAEVQALRCVRAAEITAGLRRFEEAEAWRQRAAQLCQGHAWAGRLLASALRASQLRGQLLRDPLQQQAPIQVQAALVRLPAAAAPVGPADADAWLVMAQAAGRRPPEAGAEPALAWARAALMVALVAGDAPRAQRACAQLSRLHARARSDWHDPQLGHALAWHGLSEVVHHRFELPLASAWEYIHIGQLWLEWPAELRLAEPLSRFMWNHLTPDALAFHQVALDLAQQVADPMQIACAAINLHQRALATRHRDEADAALRLLVATMKAHPDLRAAMVDEGWEFPAPLRRRRARVPAHA